MAAADPGISMNNHLNCILWHQDDIIILPITPKQKIEIAVSDEADIHVYDFAGLLMKAMKEISS